MPTSDSFPRPMLTGVGLLAASGVCLSASAVLITASGVAPITAGALRCALALVILAPFVFLEWRRRGPLPRRALIWGAIAGVALGLDFSNWNISVLQAGAGVATVLINVQVIVVPVLLRVFDRATIPRRVWLIAPIMLLGVALAGNMIGSLAGSMVEGTAGQPPSLRGVLHGVIAGAAYAGYLYAIRRGGPETVRSPIGTLAVACAAAMITAGVLALVTGDAEWPASPRAWLMLGALALFGQVAAFALINRGTALLPPDVAGPLLLLPTVFALPMAAIVLGEIPTAWQLLGCAIVLGATWWATVGQLPRIRPRHWRSRSRRMHPTVDVDDLAGGTREPVA